MGHDQGQRVLVLRLDVDEVNVHAVDLGCELGQGIELGLGPAPVVLCRPVACEHLERLQLHPLRAIRDELGRGPARRLDAATEVGEFLIGNAAVDGGTYVDGGLGGRAHDDHPSLEVLRTSVAILLVVGSVMRLLSRSFQQKKSMSS